MSQTELSEIGEFGLIERLTRDFDPKNDSTIQGIGDDCAILSFPADKEIVVTTDLLVEGIHFDLVYCPLKHLGYKSVAVNVSDICAMNATPRQVTVSIAVSAKFTVEALEQFYEGIRLACRAYNVDLVGGDTTSSMTGMMISVTAIGEVEKGKAAKRSGAKVNDLVCVSGDLGGAYVGLQILEREKYVFTQTGSQSIKLEGYDYVLQRQLKPEARLDVVQKLASHSIVPTSMIDISDGLSSELLHICKQSGVGCKVYEEKIPVNVETERVAGEFNLLPLTCALNGGEDYELLFTVDLNSYHKLAMVADVRIIGNICDASEGSNIITRQNERIPIVAQGWNAMKDK